MSGTAVDLMKYFSPFRLSPASSDRLSHQARISASVNAMRILNTGTEVEAAVADALVRTEFLFRITDSMNKECKCNSLTLWSHQDSDTWFLKILPHENKIWMTIASGSEGEERFSGKSMAKISRKDSWVAIFGALFIDSRFVRDVQIFTSQNLSSKWLFYSADFRCKIKAKFNES